MLAIDRAPDYIVSLLLNAGVNVEQKSKNISPLAFAVFSGRLDIVNVLLEEGMATIQAEILDIQTQANQKNIELLLLCFYTGTLARETLTTRAQVQQIKYDIENERKLLEPTNENKWLLTHLYVRELWPLVYAYARRRPIDYCRIVIYFSFYIFLYIAHFDVYFFLFV